MAPTKTQHLRQDIGGRFVGDPRGFLLFVPLWWGLSLFGVPDGGDSRAFAVFMVANAIAFAVVFGVLIIFRHTWFRTRILRPLPTLQVIAAGAVLGAIKSVVTVAVTVVSLGEPDYWGLLVWRIPASAVTGAWIIPVAALVLATRARYQAQRDVLVAEILRNQYLDEPIIGLRVDDPTDARVRAVISEAKEILAQESVPPDQVAKMLRHLIDTQLRPLSYELWASTSRKFTDFSLTDLLRVMFTHNRYWVLATTVAVAMSNGPFVITVVGWVEGLGRVVIITTLAGLTLVILRRGTAISAGWGLAKLAAGTLLFTCLNELAAWSLFGPFSTWSAVASGGANAAFFFTGAVVLGVVRVARQDNQDIRRELENLLGDSSWRGRLSVEQARLRHREVAELLHGQVQNRLLSVVLALTTHPDTRRRSDVAAELTAIEKTLFGSRQLPSDDVIGHVHTELAELAKRWAGIVDVSVVSALTEEVDHALVTTVGRVGEEAISNAVRHGLAGAVELGVEKSGDDMVVTVSDNGVGPRNGQPGLGSLYLSQAAGKNWSLRPGPDGIGSLLTVRLRIREGKE